MNWNDGKEILENRNFDISNCSIVDLCKFITVFTRNDRFSDGFLSEHIKNGNVLKIVSQIKSLIDNEKY